MKIQWNEEQIYTDWTETWKQKCCTQGYMFQDSLADWSEGLFVATLPILARRYSGV